MEPSRENNCERLKIDECDVDSSDKFNYPSNLPIYKLQYVISLMLIIILPASAAPGEYECGINRFNNESPLTERIVGGNNSLQ